MNEYSGIALQMKKIISLTLSVLIAALTLTGCFSERYSVGDNEEEDFYEYLCKAKFESGVNVFDRDAVALDFYYGLYQLSEDRTLDEIAEGYKNNKGLFDDRRGDEFFTVHICKNVPTSLKQGKIISDYENLEDAILFKVISHDQAFNGGYGYSLFYPNDNEQTPSIIYEHVEELFVPEDLIGVERYGAFNFYISTLIDYYDSDEYYVVECARYMIQYELFDGERVKILFD